MSLRQGGEGEGESGESEKRREYKMIVREEIKLSINDIAVCLETAARINK